MFFLICSESSVVDRGELYCNNGVFIGLTIVMGTLSGLK